MFVESVDKGRVAMERRREGHKTLRDRRKDFGFYTEQIKKPWWMGS